MNSKLESLYTRDFYKGQMTDSYTSGRKYALELQSLYKPLSVIDVGCGSGTWLKAFGEIGSARLVGVDGDWNNQASMIDQTIEFFEKDLNLPFWPREFGIDRFDLAMSLEVAEHLNESSADQFVESLTKLSDGVLFGAAYTKQGGTNHINEQPHTYWAEKFKGRNYVPFDLFREKFWGDRQIPFWYQQNTFLYVKQSTTLFMLLTSRGKQPLENINFLNCVHPQLYQIHINRPPLLKLFFRKLIPRSIQSFLRRAVKEVFKKGRPDC